MENKWQILVVDDEDMIRTNLQAYLEDENYPVMVAESGEKAVEIVKLGLFTPDVAVVDMRLPNMDGNSVILALNELNPKI
ncbi:MAG: response regulator, partial [Gammaproteobacteria bacterium]